MPITKPFTGEDLARAVRRKRRSSASVWGEIALALNPAYSKPRLAPDVEVADFHYRSGEPYTMMKAQRGPSYIRLTAEDRFIVDQMNGQRSIRDIVVAHFQRYGHFALSAITSLIEEMRRAGFLTQPYVSVQKVIADAKRDDGPRWLVAVRKIRAKKRLDMKRPNELTEWLYRHGGSALYTKSVGVVFVVVTIAGLVAAWDLLHGDRFSVFGTSALWVLALYVIDLLAIFIHEAAHALSCRHFGRRVNAAGFMFYLGMPLFFIETTDTWMADRRGRVWTSWSGPYSGFIIGGACAIAAWAMPTNAISAFLFSFAIFSYYGTLQNLVPFLRLDGYYIMMDLIDTQNLRERAFAFVRGELVPRLRSRTKLTREEKLLSAYGLIASVFAVLAILVALAFWSRVFRKPITSAWAGGWTNRALILGLGILVLSAPIRALARLVRSIVRRARFVSTLVLRAAQFRWRADAASLIGAMPMMTGVDADQIMEIANRVALRRIATGWPVVTEGESGSEFFLVRSGRLEVVHSDAGGKEVGLRMLERGASFGEIALLQASPRTATVRAVEDSEVFALDKGTFDRLIAERVDIQVIRETLVSVRELLTLAPFANLDASDAAAVIEHAEWVTVAAKTALIREGHQADAFFVIGSGQLEVLSGRKRIRLLGPGDYFGELALLLDQPRTATVRAMTPSRVLKLDRKGFDATLALSFRRGSLHPHVQMVQEWEH